MNASQIQCRIDDPYFHHMIETLGEFVAIPSVSNPKSPDYSVQALDNAAQFTVQLLKESDFEPQLLEIGDAPKFVFAQRVVNAAYPTILLYGHYDVQPVDRDKWDTNPFHMERREARLYGRGASDDKAGVVVITKALQFLRSEGIDLQANIKVLIEGDEEYDSEPMTQLIQKYAAMLDADALVVMDGGNMSERTGTLESSTRGILTLSLRVDALAQPTHSGVGCLTPDPGMALCKLVSSLENPREIPGFMDGCIPLTQAQIQQLNEASISEEGYAAEHRVVEGAHLRGDSAKSVFQRVSDEPSLSVINMECGKLGGGNSIQSHAEATIGIRLTDGQDPEKVFEVVQKYLNKQEVLWNLPLTLRRIGAASKAWATNPIEKPFARQFLESMSRYYPKTAVMPTGGAIPMFSDFEKTFPGIDAMLVGVEDPKTNAHSHNESQSLSILRNATDSLMDFLVNAGNLSARRDRTIVIKESEEKKQG